MIEVNLTSLPEVLLIKRRISFDYRGFFCEEWNRDVYMKAGIDINFKTDEFSRSKHGVLRGLHGDKKTWKLISCTMGKIFLAVINYSAASPHFGEVVTFILTPENAFQVLIPPFHLNGHYVLSPEGAQFKYKQSEYYTGAENQFSVRWNDPRFNIPWPLEREPILSDRDKNS